MGTHRAQPKPAATEPEAGAAPQPESACLPRRGSWRAQAASRLLAPLKLPLVLGCACGSGHWRSWRRSLLVERQAAGLPAPARTGCSRSGSPRWLLDRALLAAALTLWLHRIDARFGQGVALAAAERWNPARLGWFTSRVRSPYWSPTTRWRCTTVTHAVPTRSPRLSPCGGALSICSSWTGEWRWSCSGRFWPDHHVIAHDPIRAPHCSSAAVWAAEKMNG